ncbi:MAG: KamA family radical SAM protein [Pseudohongiellaceae bacterium]
MPESVIKLVAADDAEKWQSILADLVTEPKELLQILGLEPQQFPVSEQLLSAFPLKVPRPYIARMEKGNSADPLLRQVLPLSIEGPLVKPAVEPTEKPIAKPPAGQLKEQDSVAATDPLQEQKFNPLSGLLHKYDGRVLLTVAPHCAVHCRYCFRRGFDYQSNTPGRLQWHSVFDYIQADPSIKEVIFSGGDPLAVGDRQLAWLAGQIAAIPHVERLRIHTRTPVVIPQRVTRSLIDWLTGTRLKTVVVLHCNHAREIDDEVGRAFGMLATNGITLLNQSVLLRGVNDSSAVLSALSEKLFSVNVLPYYLHLLDPVPGVEHFDVPESEARQIVEGMRSRLPGYLVPRLVREVAGHPSKLSLG